MDYLHKHDQKFMKLYRVGSHFQRRVGGQGLVQFVERERDGELFSVKVRLCSSACICSELSAAYQYMLHAC